MLIYDPAVDNQCSNHKVKNGQCNLQAGSFDWKIREVLIAILCDGDAETFCVSLKVPVNKFARADSGNDSSDPQWDIPELRPRLESKQRDIQKS